MPPTLEHIRNFYQFSPTIATSGQPAPEDFSLIQAFGYQLVINLATPTSSYALANEQQLVLAAQMRYIHIPVTWEAPEIEHFDQVAQILQSTSEPVFIHCALNYRVSCFCFLFNVLLKQEDPIDAWWTLLEIWEPNPVWKQFLTTILSQRNPQALHKLRTAGFLLDQTC